MTLLSNRRFTWLLRSSGADLGAWPARDRVAALELLRRSADARTAMADALMGENETDFDLGRDGPVIARMQSVLSRSLAPLPFIWRSLRAGALVACVALGLYIGAGVQDTDQAGDIFGSTQTVTFAALDQ